jgi:hypothetical protein
MKPDQQQLATNSIHELGKLIEDGINSWTKAGEIVVHLVDDQGLSLEDIVQQSGSELLNVNLLSQFERIGRKQVMPRLLASSYPAAAHLQRLPLSEQKRLMDGSVELVVNHDGKFDLLQVNVRHLTKHQCKQVFDSQDVRSAGAQRAWLEEQSQSKENSAIRSGQNLLWTVKNGKVIFRTACEVTRHELAVILTQLA